MKVSKSKLERIIREELAAVLEAHQMPIAGHSYRGAPYKRDDDEVDPYERPMESPLEEEAPPGMEDDVEALKKKHPDDVAFKIAWSNYNKRNNKS
tara:strand:- start:1449 stop:1733 length:285 start_codon:yes stop_codon:yes gene_type:complete